MDSSRRKHTDAFKAQLSEQLLCGQMTVAQLSAEHDVHPSLLHRWREEFLARGRSVAAQAEQKAIAAEVRKLQARNSKLQRQVDFLAGALGVSPEPSAKSCWAKGKERD